MSTTSTDCAGSAWVPFHPFHFPTTSARSRLGSGAALGPSWVNLALITAVFSVLLGWLHLVLRGDNEELCSLKRTSISPRMWSNTLKGVLGCILCVASSCFCDDVLSQQPIYLSAMVAGKAEADIPESIEFYLISDMWLALGCRFYKCYSSQNVPVPCLQNFVCKVQQRKHTHVQDAGQYFSIAHHDYLLS